MIDSPLNRLNVLRGESLPQSKMTESTVREARKLHAESREAIKKLNQEFSIKGLARRYGVHERTMEKILAGYTWSHV